MTFRAYVCVGFRRLKEWKRECLEAKVSALEKIVVRLEEKLELLEHEDKGIEETDFSTFDKLHTLVRSDSLKRTCEQCEFVARNKARLNVHKEIKHNHTCDICNNSKTYYGDVKFRDHLELVHENGSKSLTDEEFDMLETWEITEIKKGPETVRKANMLKKN